MKPLRDKSNWKVIKEFTDKDREDAKIWMRKAQRRSNNKPNRARVICPILADLYYSAEEEDVKEILLEAIWMAKRMSKKLGEYKVKPKNRF